MKETKPDWIHARVPPKKQGAYNELLNRGYKKTDIAMAGFLLLCKKEKIEVPA